jgi:uncharacterized protein (TIGR02453 family)
MPDFISEKSFQFLAKLAEHTSDRDWFEKHKPEYKKYIYDPLHELAVWLGPVMLSLDADFEVTPRRVISRIYKDTRFSRDKALYKSNMWLTFKRPDKAWRDAPCFFFEIFPDGFRYGMGFYQAASATMHGLRGLIAEEPQEFLRLMEEALQIYTVQGEPYKKPPKSALSTAINEIILRRNFYLERWHTPAALPFNEVMHGLVPDYEALRDIYIYLMRAKARMATRRPCADKIE